MQNQGVFKDNSRVKQILLRSSKLAVTVHAGIQRKPKILKMKHFLVCHDSSCTLFFKLSFGHFFKLLFVLFIAVNKVNSELSQIPRSLINFQGVSSVLEMTFHIPALCRKFKDLHKP